ncbi:ABC transporter ATP-binding protein [Arthrobacter sp. MYb213]|uniref:ABC transporter ATP-binding protein n=1 Tax=Arthrobacter sp. MYb213 TaxID=1848595 RepID=UPI000CFE27A9|nr:ABC transporter ATP-binding protein [Arthrobacter sp. MYb213]PRB69476.1 ABC transporter ATP-binding protein [Arthrobacter sp. MYb213]
MLIANSLSFKGRHGQLVDKTSLAVERGALLLVVADAQLERTALALMLSGRMSPSSGTVQWSTAPGMKTLRAHSALVDSPQVNEPEAHLKVRDVVSEDLSLVPGPFWRRPQSKKWLAKHGFEHLAGDWIDAIDPQTRLDLLTQLALENHDTDCLVFDSPDRHGIDEPTWLESLEELTHTRRQLTVIAVVSRIPDSWQGPVVFAGQTATIDDSALQTATVPQIENDPEAHEVDVEPAPELPTDEPTDTEFVETTSSAEPAALEDYTPPTDTTSEMVKESEPQNTAELLESSPLHREAPEAPEVPEPPAQEEAELAAKSSTPKD